MNTPAYQTIIVKFREAITELDGIFRDTPVSYTHLDVYKRQVMWYKWYQ